MSEDVKKAPRGLFRVVARRPIGGDYMVRDWASIHVATADADELNSGRSTNTYRVYNDQGTMVHGPKED